MEWILRLCAVVLKRLDDSLRRGLTLAILVLAVILDLLECVVLRVFPAWWSKEIGSMVGASLLLTKIVTSRDQDLEPLRGRRTLALYVANSVLLSAMIGLQAMLIASLLAGSSLTALAVIVAPWIALLLAETGSQDSQPRPQSTRELCLDVGFVIESD